MKPYELEFEINELPKMANPSGARSTHWRYAKQEVDKWRRLVWFALKDSAKPKKPLKKFELLLVRYSSTEPDYDGLVRGFKSVIDGLKHCQIIEDDRLSNTGPWLCNWELTKPKQGKIFVRVKEKLGGEL